MEKDEDGRTKIRLSELSITRKQFYSRMDRMIKAGLIKRTYGKYTLTSLEKILYNIQTILDTVVTNQWKLKAIDSIQTSYSITCTTDDTEPPSVERRKIIDRLIDDHEIKNLLIREKVTKTPINIININDSDSTKRIITDNHQKPYPLQQIITSSPSLSD